MAKKIFLSYSRKDKDFAKKVANDLEKAGYIVWWDISTIEGGDRWAQEIEAGINQSEILALIVSPNSIASEWVEKEFIFASKRGMKIVPLLYEHCELPIWLLNLQYVDLIGINYKLNFLQVIEAFEKYGRRAGDTKALPPTLGKRISRLSPYWLLLIIITLLLLLIGFLLKPILFPISPTPTRTYTATATYRATETKEPTKTATNTPIPPTETGTATPTSVPTEEKATPSPTVTRTPTLPATPTEEGLASLIVDKSGAEMLLVEAAPFLMGRDTGNNDEKPAHLVNLGDYYIDKYEVSNADYKACVDDFACSLPKPTTFYADARYRSHPAVFVSWEKANEYCEWREARLPTEAEWEKAARGDDSLIYPWGNMFSGSALNFCDAECEYSWKNTGIIDKYSMTAPIGTYPDGESPYGVLDMAGNAAEWVADWYDKDYYENTPRENPQGPEDGTYRVLRGGSWYNRSSEVRTYQRNFLRPNIAYNYTGFRCAISAEE
ncbi:MAG: SUMF1/EgtB/PvdO family nonheme iron enzyme [Chloroflexi bacterium]|nr:SUMF1/EgtB/PvdO family nonheme iron enzyme [Chloroflexota bacterium]